jgi:sialate O-acetylesterase
MNRAREIALGALVGLAALLGSPAGAEVKPHGLFTDGAVLQQGMKVPVWGTASDGEKVTVSFRDQKVSTTAQGGQWMAWLKPLKAGGPDTLKISGQNTVEVKNVLVGEVYICSGQSNMEFGLASAANGPEAVAASKDPMLRLNIIPKATSETPLHEVNSPWKESGPDTSGGFSAVGYFFGRDLRRALKVPVGLIESNWGGTVAEAWTSNPTLEGNPELESLVTSYRAAKRNYPFALMTYNQALAQYQKDVETAKAEGKDPPKPPVAPGDPANPGNPNRPSVLYNAMIVPLQPYAIRGVIWYQGESNAGRAYQYQTLFPAMIRDWRSAWGQGDFAFLFVQLAPFMQIQEEPGESAWAELREAQRLTTLTVPKTGMAVITDVGEEKDIHPRKKEPVGSRLALAARALANGSDIEYSGPTFDTLRIDGSRAIVRFKHVGGGLTARDAKDGKISGFTIAGADRKWHAADAVIEGNRVIVSSPQVQRPVAVRYGWANYPVVNLWNKDGLPASPFRTDDFPLTTQPAR